MVTIGVNRMRSATNEQLDDVETQILGYFRREDQRAHTQEIAEAIGSSRHTTSKYLSVLEARGLIDHEEIGNAKVWYPIEREIQIRSLASQDIERIIEISHDINDIDEDEVEQHNENLREELQAKFDDGDGAYCVGAESQGQLVGYMIGEERSWEFGHDEKAGWIRILGVAPEYQGKNIGRMLGDEMLYRFEENDVKRIRTIVDWDKSDFLPFFHALGFGMKESTVLEKTMDANNDE